MARPQTWPLLLILIACLAPAISWSQETLDVEMTLNPDLEARCSDRALTGLPPLAPGEHTLHLRIDAGNAASARAALVSFTDTLRVIGPEPAGQCSLGISKKFFRGADVRQDKAAAGAAAPRESDTQILTKCIACSALRSPPDEDLGPGSRSLDVVSRKTPVV